MMYRKAVAVGAASLSAAAVVICATLVVPALAASPAPTPAASPAAATPSPSPQAVSAAPCADSAHSTICAVGRDPVAAAGNAAAAAPGAVVGSIAGDATDSFTRWVASGAAYVMNQTGNWLQTTTPPQLNSTWWNQHYSAMRRLAVVLMFPFLMAALIKAIARHDPAMMVRAFFIRVPLAFALTGAAVVLTTLLLTASDEMTTAVAGPALSGDAYAFMHNLGNSFTESTAGGNPTPLFLVAIAALLTVLAGLVMFMELLVRSGVIYLALLFMPLALAASVWAGAEKWARRLAETVVAAVLSKFVIITVISLAAGALAADTAAARGGGAGGSGDGIGGLLTGVILLGLAAFAPYKIFRMLPAMESAAIGQLEGLRQRGVGGAKAAVSAPRDALERLSRLRATEAGALSGRAFRGAGVVAGAGGAAVAGVVGAAATGAAFARRRPNGGAGESGTGGHRGGGGETTRDTAGISLSGSATAALPTSTSSTPPVRQSAPPVTPAPPPLDENG